MAVIKCPHCGHRHLQVVPLCVNCGMPLSAKQQRTPQPHTQNGVVIFPTSQQNTSAHDEQQDHRVVSYQRFMLETKEHPSQSAQEREHTTTAPRAMPADPASPPSRQLVKREELRPAERQVWKKKTEVQPYAPYETAVSIAAPDPFAQPTDEVIIHEEPSDPEHWKTDKLPWYFLKVRPNIAGSVIHMETKEEVVDYPDLFAALITLLVEFVWILTDIQQERESDRVVMTTVRVQTHTGALKDARLRGNMRGANLSLGDEVSFWGIRRHGVLFVNHGFNHTTKAVVFTSSIGLIVPALLFVAFLLAGIYFAPTWFPIIWHHLLATLSSYFSFLHQHPITPPMQKKK